MQYRKVKVSNLKPHRLDQDELLTFLAKDEGLAVVLEK